MGRRNKKFQRTIFLTFGHMCGIMLINVNDDNNKIERESYEN